MRDRPYIEHLNHDLVTIYRAYPGDIEVICDIAYELQFRRAASKEFKAEVIEHLIELAEQVEVEEPMFPFPSIDVVATRSRLRHSLGSPEWRENGLLKLSGYCVGKTEGKPDLERRKILNYIFLKDELLDVDDEYYASEWGEPKSEDRLKKLTNSIASFVRNAKRSSNNMSYAIGDWSEDIHYLKETFYDRWFDFPWPYID